MSALSAPFGLRVPRHYSGRIYATDLRLTKALSEATPTMFQGTPVSIDTTGRLALAANGADFIGSFAGVEYTDLATGRPTVTSAWINGTLVKDQGGDSARFYFYRDPDLIYEIQVTDGAKAYADIGAQINFDANIAAGNTTTLYSIAGAAGLQAAGVQGMLRIIDIARYVDNDWTDAFPILQVQVARHQDVALKVGY